MLKVRELNVRYGAVSALEGVSLDVAAGEVVCLIGANGAGKSSLLNAISRVVPHAGGTIEFDGQRTDANSPESVVRAGIMQVPEGRQVFGRMTVTENLLMGAYSRRKEPLEEDLERVHALFPRLKEREGQLAGLMSGGEQQMLAIGRALMSRPRLLLLDEPSMGLAPVIIQDIFAALRRLHRSGLSILLVEQNAAAALRFAERAYVLTTGRVAMSGSSAQLLDDERVRAAFLGHAVAA
jgi:branched-chain amino acid transport system ATP-binding protein